MKLAAMVLLVGCVPVFAQSSCLPPAAVTINAATAAALNDLYSEYESSTIDKKAMDRFLSQFNDGDKRPVWLEAGHEGMTCSPDTCHAYVRIPAQYLREVLNDALTRRLADLRCSILKLGGQLPPPH